MREIRLQLTAQDGVQRSSRNARGVFMMASRLFAALAALLCIATPACADAPPADFWHAGLVVSDLETMDAFYTRVIGLRRVTDLRIEDAGAPPRWRGRSRKRRPARTDPRAPRRSRWSTPT